MYTQYLQEIKIRIIYYLIALLLSGLIMQFHLQTLIFLKVWPIIIILKIKFLALHVLELLLINLTILTFNCLLVLIPKFMHQLSCYNYASWYRYQIYIWIHFKVIVYKTLVLFNLFSYLIIVPSVIWCLISPLFYKKLNLLINLNVELQLMVYIIWFLKLNYSILYLILMLWLFFLLNNYFTKVNVIYKCFNNNKKFLIICMLIILFFVLPSNNSIQLFIIFMVFLSLEIMFIYINYKYSLVYKWVLYNN